MSKHITNSGIITTSIFLVILLLVTMKPIELGVTLSCRNGEFEGFSQTKESLIGKTTADCKGRIQVYVNHTLICDETAISEQKSITIPCEDLGKHTGSKADIYYMVESKYGGTQQVREAITIET